MHVTTFLIKTKASLPSSTTKENFFTTHIVPVSKVAKSFDKKSLIQTSSPVLRVTWQPKDDFSSSLLRQRLEETT